MEGIYLKGRSNVKAALLWTLLLALLSQVAFAQSTRYTVSGTVTDALTKIPLPGVVFKFQNSNSWK